MVGSHLLIIFASSFSYLASGYIYPLTGTATQCESFGSSQVTGLDSVILNSTSVAAGALSIDGVNNSIAFCRVFASVSYAGSNNSVIYEVWLPDSSYYNGRYLSVGKFTITPDLILILS